MELNQAIQDIKQSESILISELNSIGSYPAKTKGKYNCPSCGSKDNLGIHMKNGEWRVNCFNGGCLLNGDSNIIDTMIKFKNKDIKKDFYQEAKEIANRNGIEIDNQNITKEQKEKNYRIKAEKKAKKSLIDNLDKEQTTAIMNGNIKRSVEIAKEIDNIENEGISQYNKDLISCLVYNKNGTIGLNQVQAGEIILGKYKFINNDRFYYKYDECKGVWTKFSKQGTRTLVTKDLKEACNYYSDGTSRSLSNYIFDMTYGNIEGETFDEVFNKDPYKVVFKNGTLNIKTNEFIESFNSEDYNTIIIPHNYNSEAGIPNETIAFLSMMTDNLEEIRFIFQWMGYLLVKKYDITKMLFIVGDGGNGKSTLIKLMTSVVGNDNTSTVSMKSLINNRFQSALLYNKLFNTVADIGADFFEDSSILKALTGDDHITIERKGENGFSYLNFAKMTYSCNKLPRFKDTTGGLNRRPIILPLNKDFSNIVRSSGSNISDIINNEEEIERIIKYSIDKFREVLANKKAFTESELMIQTKNDWLNEDPLVDFIEETFEIIENSNLHTTMESFMGLYKIYCSDRNYKPMSQKNVIEAIRSNKKLTAAGIDIKRISNKTKKLKITNIIKVKDDVDF